MIHTADPTPYLHTLPANWAAALLLLLAALTVASVTAAIVWHTQTHTPHPTFTPTHALAGHPR